MRILFVSAEVAPFAKVGGLADVAAGLPKALAALGHEVRVVMPLYQMIEDQWHPAEIARAHVQINPSWMKAATVGEIRQDDVTYNFIGTDEWFPLAVSSETVYQPGAMPHLFFSEAVIQFSRQLDWQPDVVHCNDWHTGFIPVLLKEKYQDDTRTLFTIHNFAYQGEFGTEILDLLDLPMSLFTSDKLETWGRVNFIKAGCVYSDQVNTVSPTYAREIQTPEFGNTLEGLMIDLARHGRLSGILNGIDTHVFDPASDPALASDFSADNLRGKADCRKALLHELDLPSIEGALLVGMVTRISSQKGLDLVLAAAKAIFELPVQLVVQGLGEPALLEGLGCLQDRFPRHLQVIQKFDAPLAQRVYAGCDAFAMPSSFEPCGLGQMIAMRYGTVPIVRKTGGLADTVHEGQNGFVFEDRNPVDLIAAMVRAHNAFLQPEEWARLQQNAMRHDFGWHDSALQYVHLYKPQ